MKQKPPAPTLKRHQTSLELASDALLEMASNETDLNLKVVWLRAAAQGYEEQAALKRKP